MIKNIILHQIIRENNQDPELNLSDKLLAINDITNDFVEKLVKSYTDKHPSYGTFDNDIENNPFQTNAREYFSINNDFLGFSIKAMNTLKKEINIPQAKGGYVVFVHYAEKLEDFIVTVMLDNSERFVVDKNLNIEKLLGLDIDKVARACRINWQQWQNKKESYLSFIKGTRGVSNYFANKFIGCTDYKSSKQNAKHLESAVNGYMNENNFNDDKKRTVRQNLKSYVDRQINDDNDIIINSISAIINTDNTTDFVDYIDNNSLRIGNFHSTRKNDFKGFDTKIVKGDGYTLEFTRNSENIMIDKKNHTITIRNIPNSDLEN